ncbi:MAG TPA: GNAT family N-acetyltransferase [Gemmatimonadaceae bacterium]
MLTLGPLNASHRAALHRLLCSTDAFRAEEVAVALELFDETFGPTKPTGDYEFVAAFNGADALVGYCCYGATPTTDATYDLYWIAVDLAHQGGGVGSLLLEEVEHRVRGRRGRMVVIETSAGNGYDSARRFYGARGYDVAARLRDYYGPADDRVVFTRQFDRSLSPAHSGA